MLFSSITFLYYFLPITLLIYFVVPKKWRNLILLLASLLFYGWGEPRYLLLMIAAILQGYAFGRWISMAKNGSQNCLPKLLLGLSVGCSLGMLGVCKYADFALENINSITHSSIPLLHIALPIGISFYTFQIVSYTVDVYRGTVPAQRNFIAFSMYIAMFPQLVAGPIVRYQEIAPALSERTLSLSNTVSGLRRFLVGLSKKVILANTLAEIVDAFSRTTQHSVLFVWLFAVAYALQIYFDFSGYSDMAIGLGCVLGFHFPENFNYPYISKSITEFWRRWHMSLGSWFRDYLYIPMGGNRVPKWRWMCNIFIVWMATGFWHGAAWNFILWGLFFAVLLMLEKCFLLRYLQKIHFLNHIYVLICLVVSFVIFEHTNLKEAFSLISQLFGAGNLPFITSESLYYLKSNTLLLLISAIGATPLPAVFLKKCRSTRYGAFLCMTLEPLFLVALLLLTTAFLMDSSFQPFLYFRF